MSLFDELKRRNVIRVAVAYAVVAWVLMQMGDILFSTLELGPQPSKILLAILLLGFVPAVIVAWAFEITPEGIKKEKDVERDASITNLTAKKLDMVTIGLLLVAIVLFGLDRISPRENSTNTNAIPASAGAQSQEKEILPTNGSVPDINTKSIAVLPFIPLSSDEEDAYFGKGIAEELLNALAKFPKLKVAARTSAFSFDGKDIDLRDVGSQLGVAHVLEGSVRSSGDKVRVTAQLIRVADGFHLWSETYDRNLTDIFAVQDEIVQEINRTLQIRLGVGVGAGRAAGREVDPVAYQNYLRGLESWGLRDNNQKRNAAILAFRLATTQDPNFADGWAAYGQALALSSAAEAGLSLDDRQSFALHALDTALELDPENVRALAALGIYYCRLELDVVRSTDYIRQALHLAPNSADVRYAATGPTRFVGTLSEVKQTFDQAIALDPLNNTLKRVYSYDLASRGDIDGVSVIIESCTGCNVIDNTSLQAAKYMAARRGGSDDQVRGSAAEYHADLNKNRDLLEAQFGSKDFARQRAISTPAYVEMLLGGSSLPDEDVKAFLDLGVEEVFFELILLMAQIGETTHTLDLLYAAYDTNLTAVFLIAQPMGRDVWPDSVRRDPRFHAFWQKPGMPELAELLRTKGITAGLPLSLDGAEQ